MYTFTVSDCLSVPVKVTRTRTGSHVGHNVLFAEATLVLSPANPEGVTVCLMALDTQAHLLVVEDDFVVRELLFDVGRACNPKNPYARHTIGIARIWFPDPGNMIGKTPVSVEGEGKLFDMADDDIHRLNLTRIVMDI